MKAHNTLSAILVSLFVLGCSHESGNNDLAQQPAYQKPGAAIRLAEPQKITMAADSQERFALRFSTPNQGQLILRAEAKTGLVLEEAGHQWQFDLENQSPEITLTLSSSADGRYHVMFFAEMQEAGASMSRVFGIPVYVGEQTPVTQKAQSPQIIMKAEERIRQ